MRKKYAPFHVSKAMGTEVFNYMKVLIRSSRHFSPAGMECLPRCSCHEFVVDAKRVVEYFSSTRGNSAQPTKARECFESPQKILGNGRVLYLHLKAELHALARRAAPREVQPR